MNHNYYIPPQDNGTSSFNYGYNANTENQPNSFSIPNQSSYVKVKKEIKPMEKKDSVFMFLFFAATFIFVDFAVFHGFNLGFTIAFFVFFAVLTAYLYKKEMKPSVFSVICGVMSLAGSVTLAVFRDVFMNCIMVFLVAFLFTIYTCGLSGTFRNKEGSIRMLADVFGGVFIAPVSNLFESAGAFSKSVSTNKKILNAVIGVAVSLPVLFVVILLLASGDAAFEGLISMVAKDIGVYLGELLLAAVVTPFVVSYAFSKKRNLKTGSDFASKNYSQIRFSPNVVSVSFLSAISFVYIVFLFSQLAYFFSAFSGILPAGYELNAAGYARRGFFEMFVICVINLIIISLANLCTKKLENNKISGAIKALSTFILLFSVLLLITAMSKMKLYIDNFGLTKYRLLVSVFMIMLVVAVFFYVLHIFAPKVNYMQPIIIICSVIFIAISFADIDKVIVKYDVDAYKNGRLNSVDVDYLNELTAAATPYLIELTEVDDAEISNKAKSVISKNINYKYSDKLSFNDNNELVYNPDFDFREYNFVVDNACREYEEFFNALSDDEKSVFHTEQYNPFAAVELDKSYQSSEDKYQKLVNEFYIAPDDDYVYYFDEQNDIYCDITSREVLVISCFYDDELKPSYVALRHEVYVAMAYNHTENIEESFYEATEEYRNAVIDKIIQNTNLTEKDFQNTDSELYYEIDSIAFDMAYIDYFEKHFPDEFNDERVDEIISNMQIEAY